MVDFKFSINIQNVIKDRKNYDITKLDFKGLKYIAFGNIIITFENTDQKMDISSGLIDYLYLLESVIASFSTFNKSFTFTVSSYDFYSANFEYEYNKNKDVLKIKGITDCLVNISCSYSEFKSSFFKFKSSLVKELVFLYPELVDNETFSNLWLKQKRINFPNYRIG